MRVLALLMLVGCATNLNAAEQAKWQRLHDEEQLEAAALLDLKVVGKLQADFALAVASLQGQRKEALHALANTTAVSLDAMEATAMEGRSRLRTDLELLRMDGLAVAQDNAVQFGRLDGRLRIAEANSREWNRPYATLVSEIDDVGDAVAVLADAPPPPSTPPQDLAPLYVLIKQLEARPSARTNVEVQKILNSHFNTAMLKWLGSGSGLALLLGGSVFGYKKRKASKESK